MHRWRANGGMGNSSENSLHSSRPTVFPAQTGIQAGSPGLPATWISACAEMTMAAPRPFHASLAPQGGMGNSSENSSPEQSANRHSRGDGNPDRIPWPAGRLDLRLRGDDDWARRPFMHRWRANGGMGNSCENSSPEQSANRLS